jgi:exopolysaccharide biosynthesis operon protein EpsL
MIRVPGAKSTWRANHQRQGCGLLGGLAVAGWLLLGAGLAWADADDPVNLVTGATIQKDDNLFRLPVSADPQVVLGRQTRAEQLGIGYVGIRFDKRYAQQQFQFDATVTDYRYRTFSYLSYQARDFRAAWLWHLTSRLGGSFSTDRTQTQANFADNRNFSGSNTRSNENRRLNADWTITGSWHLTGGAAESRQLNSQTFTAEDAFTESSANTGVRYVAESGSTLALVARQARGEYQSRVLNIPAALDTGYGQKDLELSMAWRITGKSTINGRLTHLERKHNNLAQRDYKGNAGQIDYLWLPTGKLQIGLAAARSLSSFQTTASSYYVNDSLTLTPVWRIDSQISLRGRFERSQRDYQGPLAGVTTPARLDQSRNAQISLDWVPQRALTLSASLQRDQRTSNEANLDYDANIASVSAQLMF